MSRLTGTNLPDVHFITGSAGTGKTFTQLAKIQENPQYGKMAATTGIAAVNLDAITINSVLKYFDSASLRDNYVSGKLHARLREVEKDFDNLVIDEISMMDGVQLDCIYEALEELHDDWAEEGKGRRLGLVITGDFCQLPPIKSSWAFESRCWEHFHESTERLTKVWRQGDQSFLTALNFARGGMGNECAQIIRDHHGAEFRTTLDMQFDGTTIMAKNDSVDRYNSMRLLQLTTPTISLQNDRWGQQRGEWKIIPECLMLKEGALVMVLANEPVTWEYVNGDLGKVISADTGVQVELKRTQEIATIPRITRFVESAEPPREMSQDEVNSIPTWNRKDIDGDGAPWGRVSYETSGRKYIIGAICYYPVRLAYASTVHKTQGLSLDTIQIDLRDGFFGTPAMAYVAMSRARKIEGIRFVGSLEQLARRIKIDEKVRPWL